MVMFVLIARVREGDHQAGGGLPHCRSCPHIVEDEALGHPISEYIIGAWSIWIEG
jgi:hypothetical protein